MCGFCLVKHQHKHLIIKGCNAASKWSDLNQSSLYKCIFIYFLHRDGEGRWDKGEKPKSKVVLKKDVDTMNEVDMMGLKSDEDTVNKVDMMGLKRHEHQEMAKMERVRPT